jgi:hypothetical protein
VGVITLSLCGFVTYHDDQFLVPQTLPKYRPDPTGQAS